MSNRDRTVDVAKEFIDGNDLAANIITKRLADAGLLAPDLPEPNDPNVFVPNGKGWLPGGPYGPSVWTAPGGTVMVQRIEPGDLTPEEAREIAHALLAAANYSEGRIAAVTSENG